MAEKKTKESSSNVTTPNNIIYVAKDRVAPLEIRTHNRVIELPEIDVQKKGFYHEDAKLIISTFPEFYKEFVKLGEVK